jgi:hypothetical protein
VKQLSIAIVGITYPNKAKGPTRLFELKLCKPGEPLELRPEPKNKHDEHAIAVFSCRGVQLGYLPSERAVMIGMQRRHGREVAAVFQEFGERGAWCRVAFDGEVPTLPAERIETLAADDSGFWPDDPGGEWGA